MCPGFGVPLKQKISNFQFKSFEETKNKFRKSIISQKFNYKM